MLHSEKSRQISLRERLSIPVALVILFILVGSAGYYALGREHNASLLDAVYMTVITITTIGYGEVIPLDDVGRIFTMFIAVGGIGSLFFSLTVTMEYLVSARLLDPLGERRMLKEIGHLKDHIIIAGFGRVGRQAAAELGASHEQFVVIDPGEEGIRIAHQHGYRVIAGDAGEDAVLEKAGIRTARGLIVTSGDDASNIYIVLSARVLNPELHIVSRAADESSVPKLMRAGANRAISPYAIGGRRLAHLILSPAVVDFFDTMIRRDDETLNLEGIKVGPGAGIIGHSLASIERENRIGATILLLLRDNGVLANPTPEQVLQEGDQLLALGTTEQLDRLETLLAR